MRLFYGFNRTILSAIPTPSATLQSDNNLYYKSAVSTTNSNTVIVSYYTDNQGTNSAGTATIVNTSSAGADPQVYTVTLAISGGLRPCTGTLIVSSSTSAGTVNVSGNITENSPSGAFPATFNVTTTNATGVTVGTVTATTAGQTITIAPLSGTATNGVFTSGPSTPGTFVMTANSIAAQPANVTDTITATLNGDSSGNATLSDGSTLNWNSSGSGSVTLPNAGGSVSIAGVDNGI